MRFLTVSTYSRFKSQRGEKPARTVRCWRKWDWKPPQRHTELLQHASLAQMFAQLSLNCRFLYLTVIRQGHFERPGLKMWWKCGHKGSALQCLWPVNIQSSIKMCRRFKLSVAVFTFLNYSIINHITSTFPSAGISVYISLIWTRICPMIRAGLMSHRSLRESLCGICVGELRRRQTLFWNRNSTIIKGLLNISDIVLSGFYKHTCGWWKTLNLLLLSRSFNICNTGVKSVILELENSQFQCVQNI